MASLAVDLVPWLLAGIAFLAVGALIAAVLAIVRLDPLLGTGSDDGARRAPGSGRRPARRGA